MTFDTNLAGKIALVTGASRGLGTHFANCLAEHGAQVAFGARRPEEIQNTVDELTNAGHQAIAVELDVLNPDSIQAALSRINQTWGPANVLVNNAGVSHNKTVLQLTENDWDSTLDTNLKGPWLVAKEFALQLKAAQQPGSIINIGSILSKRVISHVAPYIASKFGLAGLTESMALELARYQIRVNTLAPGYIETDLNRDFFQTEPGLALINRIPQRRLGQASDLDGALLLLASDASQFITGAYLAVDGGHLVSTL